MRKPHLFSDALIGRCPPNGAAAEPTFRRLTLRA